MSIKNKALAALLDKIESIAQNAKKESDLNSIFADLKSFQSQFGKIAYDNGAKWMMFLFIFALGVLGFFLIDGGTEPFAEFYHDYRTAIIIVYAVLLMIVPIVIATKAARFDNISDLIFNKDILFDNEIVEMEIKDGEELFEQYAKKFGDFRNRGSEKKYIETLMEYRKGDRSISNIRYYVFHYVVVTYVPVTVRVGNTTTTTMQRVETTYYRYGIICDFPYVSNLAIISDEGSYNYSKKWDPTSEKFSKHFRTYCNDLMVASKFLKPAVVLAFENFAESFSGLNVEINANRQLIISFDDNDVISLKRKNSIDAPEEFQAEIKQMLVLPKLAQILDFIETLKRFNN